MAYKVYTDRDNSLELSFKNNHVSINHNSITNVELIFSDELTISSSNNAGLFTFNATNVSVKLGNGIIPAGNYAVTVVVYDSNNTNGIVWGDKIGITVL